MPNRPATDEPGLITTKQLRELHALLREHGISTETPARPLRTRGRSLVEKVVARLRFDGDCWRFTGNRDGSGYGRVWAYHRGYPAHVVLWEAVNGPVPAGRELDHVRDRGCTHRDCCNPDHLEPVTHRENLLRGTRLGNTHCPQNHPYDEANTYMEGAARRCRACAAANKRAWRAAK